jgi:hypothetical protein
MHGLQDIKMKKLTITLKGLEGEIIEKTELTGVGEKKTIIRVTNEVTKKLPEEYTSSLELKKSYGLAILNYFERIIEGACLNAYSENIR